MNRFLLQKIDIATGCIMEQAQFSTSDITFLAELVGVDGIMPGKGFRLDQNKFRLIADRYSVEIGRDVALGELRCVGDNFKFNPKSHTGRELFLMLGGDKPFAAFVDVHPSVSEDEIIPESYFEQYVRSGKILKFEHIERQDEKTAYTIRRVMYALPGEEWRVNAYLMMWRLAGEYGWNEGFERIEGYLLGYEDQMETVSKLNPHVKA